MPDDATEDVAEQSNTALGCNHQSICMPQLQPLCSAALVPNVLPRRDEGSGKPCAVIEACIVYQPPLRIRTRAAGFKIIKRWPLHYHCTQLLTFFRLTTIGRSTKTWWSRLSCLTVVSSSTIRRSSRWGSKWRRSERNWVARRPAGSKQNRSLEQCY